MKAFKLSVTSIILSVGAIIALALVNHQIAIRYLSADGKTKGLFSLVEILSFSYKYYLIIPAIFSLIIAAIAINKKETKWLATNALILSLFSIVFVFIPLWKIFV